MNIDEMLALPGVGLEENLRYLPQPNTADVVLSCDIPPDYTIPTAFCFPFLMDGRVILTNNRRRGAEIPGGHRDPIGDQLEFPVRAALREAVEETGAVVRNVVPVGFMRSICSGTIPDGYRYQFPHSCQQFFAGICDEPTGYVENDECLSPLIVAPDQIEQHLSGRGLILYREAFRLIFG